MSGRIAKLDPHLVVDAILRYKDEIVLGSDKIISKKNVVWCQISDDLNQQKSAASLYSFVCGNRCGVRDFLINRPSSYKTDFVPVLQLHDSNSSHADKSSQVIQKVALLIIVLFL